MGLGYLQQRRWIRRLCFLCKFFSDRQPARIHNLLPQMRNSHRHPNNVHVFVELNPSKTIFLYMSLMNEINLIETLVALLLTTFFIMHCSNSTIRFIRDCQRFDEQLFDSLSTCYTYAVNFIYCFTECFV